MTQAFDAAKLAAEYWSTSIIDIHPGSIKVRGFPIQELIGNVSFPQMIWLMLRGELPDAAQARLFEAALVASVDHGPHAPSIAISRMATSCGLPLNGAMASAINALDDVHGGAGQQAVELYDSIAERMANGAALEEAVEQGVDAFTAEHGAFICRASGTAFIRSIRGQSGFFRSWTRASNRKASAYNTPPSRAALKPCSPSARTNPCR